MKACHPLQSRQQQSPFWHLLLARHRRRWRRGLATVTCPVRYGNWSCSHTVLDCRFRCVAACQRSENVCVCVCVHCYAPHCVHTRANTCRQIHDCVFTLRAGGRQQNETQTMLLREALSSFTILLAILSLKRCRPMICARVGVSVRVPARKCARRASDRARARFLACLHIRRHGCIYKIQQCTVAYAPTQPPTHLFPPTGEGAEKEERKRERERERERTFSSRVFLVMRR